MHIFFDEATMCKKNRVDLLKHREKKFHGCRGESQYRGGTLVQRQTQKEKKPNLIKTFTHQKYAALLHTRSILKSDGESFFNTLDD